MQVTSPKAQGYHARYSSDVSEGMVLSKDEHGQAMGHKPQGIKLACKIFFKYVRGHGLFEDESGHAMGRKPRVADIRAQVHTSKWLSDMADPKGLSDRQEFWRKMQQLSTTPRIVPIPSTT